MAVGTHHADNLQVIAENILEDSKKHWVIEPVIIVNTGGLLEDADARLEKLREGSLEVDTEHRRQSKTGINLQSDAAVVAGASDHLPGRRRVFHVATIGA